jgi:hypothetical protein
MFRKKAQVVSDQVLPGQVEAGMIRLPFLSAKLLDKDGSITARDRSLWIVKSFLHALSCAYVQLVFAIVPLFLILVSLVGAAYAKVFGVPAVFQFPFILTTVFLYFGLLFLPTVIAIFSAAIAAAPSVTWVFPDAAYLSKKGLALGDKRKLIPWQKIQLVQTKELVYRGLRKSTVLEVYIESATFKKVKSSTLNKHNNFHFFDLTTKRLAVNDFEGVCLRLPLELFGFEADCQKFLQAVRENLPAEVVQSLPEMKEAAGDSGVADDGSSYTALWLDELRGVGNSTAKRLLAAGQSLQKGRYVIKSVLGYGGFSVVYAAQVAAPAPVSGASGESVAIKELVINSGGTRASKDKILKQIVGEIELLQTLEHPNIVKCLDFFMDGGRIYIVMQALAGHNLRDYLSQSSVLLSESDLREIGRQCCAILSYLHSRKIPLLHRDFTPDNLIWDGHTVKLIDFNVAEEVNTASSQTVVGKHSYLAPEQWCGNFTTAGDLYQLGCTLYFLATQRDPEPLSQSNPGLLRPELSQGFCSIVAKLTEREAESRYATADDVDVALQFDSMRGS